MYGCRGPKGPRARCDGLPRRGAHPRGGLGSSVCGQHTGVGAAVTSQGGSVLSALREHSRARLKTTFTAAVAAAAVLARAMPAAADPVQGKYGGHLAGSESTAKLKTPSGKDVTFHTSLFKLETGGKTLLAYCIEANTELDPHAGYGEAGWKDTTLGDRAKYVNWILHHSVPFLSLDQLGTEPAPTLSLSPESVSGEPGKLLGPIEVTTSAKQVDVSLGNAPEGAKLLGPDKKTEVTKAANGDKLWVSVPKGTADGAATVKADVVAKVSPGRVFTGDRKTQTLNLAGSEEVAVHDEVAVNWTHTPTAAPGSESEQVCKPNAGLKVTRTNTGDAPAGPVLRHGARRFVPLAIAGGAERAQQRTRAGHASTRVRASGDGAVMGSASRPCCRAVVLETASLRLRDAVAAVDRGVDGAVLVAVDVHHVDFAVLVQVPPRGVGHAVGVRVDKYGVRPPVVVGVLYGGVDPAVLVAVDGDRVDQAVGVRVGGEPVGVPVVVGVADHGVELAVTVGVVRHVLGVAVAVGVDGDHVGTAVVVGVGDHGLGAVAVVDHGDVVGLAVAVDVDVVAVAHGVPPLVSSCMTLRLGLDLLPVVPASCQRPGPDLCKRRLVWVEKEP